MTAVLLDLTSLNTPSRTRGHGRYVRELAIGLAELPVSETAGLEFLALTQLSLSGAFELTEDIASFEGAPGRPSPGPKDHYRWAYARRFGLARALRKTGARLVHLGDPNATPLFMGFSRCRKVVTCHDVIPARYPSIYFGVRDGGPCIGLAIERRRYQSADLVVAISDATKRDASSLLGVPAHRMRRVYNGVDIQRWQREPAADPKQVLARYGLERPFLLYVGGMDWHKNIEGMLAAVALAKADEPTLCLAWAGRLNPSQDEAIRGLARKYGLSDKLKFLGFVSDEDLSVLYRRALAHVLVSWCEGFGLTVVEAMAAGCPVLTTAGGSLAEVAGNAALTVEPNDHAEIAAALVRLARDASLRAQLIERGRVRAPQFDRAVQARGMVSAYCSALGT